MRRSASIRAGMAVLCAATLAGCAVRPEPASRPPAADESVVPGTIGVAVTAKSDAVVVAAVAKDGPAARAGVQPGDVILRFNGAPVQSQRQFERFVLDSKPGRIASLDVARQGVVRSVRVTVEQLMTSPQA